MHKIIKHNYDINVIPMNKYYMQLCKNIYIYIYIYYVFKVSHKYFKICAYNTFVLCVLRESYYMFVCGETIIKY